MRLPGALPASEEVLGLFSHILSTVTTLTALINHRKNLNMKLYLHLLIASMLLSLPACEQKSNVNRPNGVRDAIGSRPYEGMRDAAEDAGDAVKEAGRDIKDAVNGS